MDETKEKTRKKRNIDIGKLLALTAGSLIYAAGVALFLDPNNLAPGGISGIAIILNKIIPAVQTGTLVLLMNIPILALGIFKFGFKFFLSTIYAVAVSSLGMNVMSEYIGSLTSTPMLATVAGTSLVAIGIGIVFRAGGTTGGTDIIVKVLKLKFRHLNTGTVFMITDGIVILLSGLVFKNTEIVLYAGVGLFLQTRVMNTVLYSGDEARLLYIISKNKDKIADRILNELECGATYLKATGAYTKRENELLMCVVNMKNLPRTKDIVKQEDEDAFLIVTSATNVFGEGFKRHDSEEL